MKVYMLLDASGSMETSWQEMLGAINTYVEKLDADVEVSLSAFDSSHEMNYNTIRNTTARKWRNVTRDEIRPGGGTPLLDATARTLWRVLDDKQDKAVFILITDGYENSSKKFNKAEVTSMISQVQSKDFPVLFFGANFAGVSDMAQSFGIGASNTTNITPKNYNEVFTTASASTRAYNSTGFASAMSMTEDFKKKATS